MLRGINVSGQKMIKMEALRKMFEDLGVVNPQTYIQSGNVIFQFKKGIKTQLEKKIGTKINEVFGFKVPVLVKDIDELKKILKNNLFVSKRKEDLTKLHVTFLSEKPEQSNLDKIKSIQYDADEFILSGTTIYLFCPNGYGRTKLNNNFFENKLKVTATTRNWRTINELLRIAENI